MYRYIILENKAQYYPKFRSNIFITFYFFNILLSTLINWLQISRNMLKFPLLVTSSKDPMVNTPIWKKKKNYKSSSSSKILSRKARSRWLPAPAVNVSSVMHKLYLCFALFVLLNLIFIASDYSYQGNRQTDRGNGYLWSWCCDGSYNSLLQNIDECNPINHYFKLLIIINSYLNANFCRTLQWFPITRLLPTPVPYQSSCTGNVSTVLSYSYKQLIQLLYFN